MTPPFAIVPLLFGTESPMPAGIDVPTGSEPVLHRLGEDLVVGYALDRPDHYEVVLQRHLDEFGMSSDDVFRAAVATLRERAAAELVIQGDQGRYRVVLDGPSRDLTASLVLAPDLYLPRMQFSGAPVVGLGSRIWLHLADAAIPAEVEGLRGLVSGLHDAGDAKPLNRWIYRFESDSTLTRI